MTSEELNNYIGKWMLYRWDRAYDPVDIIHPDTLQKGQSRQINLSYCEGVEDGYLVLKAKVADQRRLIDGKVDVRVFKVKPWQKMIVLPASAFSWNDKVREAARPEVRGTIEAIEWHRKDNEYKYYILVNGKPKSRRYNTWELVLLEQE